MRPRDSSKYSTKPTICRGEALPLSMVPQSLSISNSKGTRIIRGDRVQETRRRAGIYCQLRGGRAMVKLIGQGWEQRGMDQMEGFRSKLFVGRNWKVIFWRTTWRKCSVWIPLLILFVIFACLVIKHHLQLIIKIQITPRCKEVMKQISIKGTVRIFHFQKWKSKKKYIMRSLIFYKCSLKS